MELQSMTAKVLDLCKTTADDSLDDQNKWTLHCLGVLDKLENYAKFLTMPLELGFFVPVDKDGNVLEEPECTEENLNQEAIEAYQQALGNVIFEGFDKCDRRESFDCLYNEKLNLHIPNYLEFNKNIESLVKYGLTITETAIKKYGL